MRSGSRRSVQESIARIVVWRSGVLGWSWLLGFTCPSPNLSMDVEGGPACLTVLAYSTADPSVGELRIENACEEALVLAAAGPCAGCAFTQTLQPGEQRTLEVSEPMERVTRSFPITVDGSGDTYEAVWVSIVGPDLRPCTGPRSCAMAPGAPRGLGWGWIRR